MQHLRGFIFTDGEILAFERREDALEMDFMTYDERHLHLRFLGCREVRIAPDTLRPRIEDARHGGRRMESGGDLLATLTLVDDDLEELLFIEYANYEVRILDLEQPVIVSECGTLEFHRSPAAVERDYEAWVAQDPAFEFFLADGSKLHGRSVHGKLRLERESTAEMGAALLRPLLEQHFARQGPRPPSSYAAMSLAELAAEGLGFLPGY